MAEISSGPGVRIPSYSITRRPDLSLQFNPPVGSLQLANALAFKYPLELDLESQIRRALMDYWESECNMSSTTGKRDPDMYPPKIATANDNERPANQWKITTRNPERKRKRSTFTNAKRKKVANVRKLGACDYHRKKKVECTCARPETTIAETPELVPDKTVDEPAVPNDFEDFI